MGKAHVHFKLFFFSLFIGLCPHIKFHGILISITRAPDMVTIYPHLPNVSVYQGNINDQEKIEMTFTESGL